MMIVAREKEEKVRMAEKEYIERKSLIDEFENLMRDDNIMCQVIKVLDALEIVEEVPSVDVVEVVRCRDCKFFGNGDCSVQSVRNMYPDDYCSYGERKEFDDD